VVKVNIKIKDDKYLRIEGISTSLTVLYQSVDEVLLLRTKDPKCYEEKRANDLNEIIRSVTIRLDGRYGLFGLVS
jgi:hypothetical protein